MATITTKSEYDLQAEAWADKYNVKMTATFIGYRKFFVDDKDSRNVYSITLTRFIQRYHSGPDLNRCMTFDFGASLNDTRDEASPTLYDVIACIEKGEPEPFESWCSNYGFDTDSRKALHTYVACQEQLHAFQTLCSGDPEMIREAQDIS